MTREITVSCMVSDKEYERAEKLLPFWKTWKDEEGKTPFKDWTPERLLEALIRSGITAHLEEKLKFEEWRQGFREDWR